jgi:hypothetical protein
MIPQAFPFPFSCKLLVGSLAQFVMLSAPIAAPDFEDLPKTCALLTRP